MNRHTIRFARLLNLVYENIVYICEDTRISHTYLSYDREKSVREDGLVLTSSRRDDRALTGSNSCEDISARYLHTIRRRGRRFRNPQKAADRLASSPAFPPLSGATRRVPPGRGRRPRFGRIPSFRYLLPVPDVEVPNRGPTGEAANLSLRARA